MSKLEDEDGIDGPWEKAMAKPIQLNGSHAYWKGRAVRVLSTNETHAVVRGDPNEGRLALLTKIVPIKELDFSRKLRTGML